MAFPGSKDPATATIPPFNYVLVGTLPENAPEGCRGIKATNGGLANVTMNGGQVKNGFDLLKGDNPGFFESIVSVPAQNAASGLWWIL